MATKKLNAAQQAALDFVAECDNRYRQAKTTARARALKQAEMDIEAFAIARDRAVFDAVELGVPKRQVGIHGLHTSSPNTIQESYDRIAQGVSNLNIELAQKHVERFSILLRGVGNLPWAYVGDGEAFVNPHFEGTVQIPESDGYVFVQMPWGPWVQYDVQAETDPAPAEMVAWIQENGAE